MTVFSNLPVFAQAPVLRTGQLTTAVTNRARTNTFTNFLKLIDAASTTNLLGTRIRGIKIKAQGDVAAAKVWIWGFDQGSGFANLIDEIDVPAQAGTSATVASTVATKVYDTSAEPPFDIGNTNGIYFTTTVTQNLTVAAYCADF